MVTYRVLEYAIRETKRQSKNFFSDAKLCGLLIVLLIPDLLYFDHKIAQDTKPLRLPSRVGENSAERKRALRPAERIYTFYILLRPERAKKERKKKNEEIHKTSRHRAHYCSGNEHGNHGAGGGW